MRSLSLAPHDADLLSILVAGEIARIESETVRYARERAREMAATEDIDRYLAILRQLYGELHQIAGHTTPGEATNA